MSRQRDSQNRVGTPRSFWVDPRFVIGIGLVLASVVGVYLIVAATDNTVEVYAASATLTPGDQVAASDLTIQRVRLGDSASRYLTPDRVPAEGVVVTRSVAAGELVPVSAVGDAATLRVASVVVTVEGELAKSIEPGALVDIWGAQKGEQSGFAPPVVLVGGATVVRVLDASGLIAQRGQAVEVLVPRSTVARMLEAVANGDAISLIPLSIPVGQ